VAFDEDLAFRIRALLSAHSAVTEQKMFGGLGFMINGNMAVGASGQGGILLRVPPESTAELVGRPHAGPFEMRGKPMEGWMRVTETGVESDADLAKWVAIGVDYAKSLPPKSKKGR
jgi:hypothetical protein